MAAISSFAGSMSSSAAAVLSASAASTAMAGKKRKHSAEALLAAASAAVLSRHQLLLIQLAASQQWHAWWLDCQQALAAARVYNVKQLGRQNHRVSSASSKRNVAILADTVDEEGISGSDDDVYPLRFGGKQSGRKRRRMRSNNPFVDAFLEEGDVSDDGEKGRRDPNPRDDYADLEDFIVCKRGKDYSKSGKKKARHDSKLRI
jgi:hypothetical protein